MILILTLIRIRNSVPQLRNIDIDEVQNFLFKLGIKIRILHFYFIRLFSNIYISSHILIPSIRFSQLPKPKPKSKSNLFCSGCLFTLFEIFLAESGEVS